MLIETNHTSYNTDTHYISKKMRRDVITMIHTSGGGHFGGALSCVDLLAVLFTRYINVDEELTTRDRFVMSKGHAAATFYCAIKNSPTNEGKCFNRYAAHGSFLQGHPDMLACPEVDFSTGSLGQGLSAGLGMAVGLKDIGRNVWVLLGDGECQEGQVWEAAMLAPRLNLSNLCAIIDVNKQQEYGFRSKDVVHDPMTLLYEKWEAFGWTVLECDGHSHRAIISVYERAIQSLAPVVVLANTVKGKSLDFLENDTDRSHFTSMTDEEYDYALRILQ